MSELWEDQALRAWQTWQAPPRFLDAPQAGCVCLDGAVVAQEPYHPAYDSLGLLLGAGVVGFIALRALGRQARLVRAIEVDEDVPYVADAAPEVVRSRSGVEAKQDVEAHTAQGKRRVG